MFMGDIKSLLIEIEEKRAKLNSAGGLSEISRKNLEEWYRVELTYTSNAIEGNTLSRAETALIVDKGITVAGKSIQEHLEASNHAEAWGWVIDKAKIVGYKFSERDLLDLHQLILQRIDDASAGKYRNVPVRIAGSRVIMPNPIKVPDLMKKYFEWLEVRSDNNILRACEAHNRLVSIHPFSDGNGRTARLVMNLLLLLSGYPPIIVWKEDRHKYLTSLETAQLGGSLDSYYELMLTELSRSLDIYLEAVGEQIVPKKKLLKMGEFAKLAGESVPTIRYWVKMGLLPVESETKGGYQLFAPDLIQQVEQIRELQREKRLSLEEIARELS